MKKSLFACLILVTVQLNPAAARVITIGTTGDYTKLKGAEPIIKAGDTLLLQSQSFSDGTQFLANLHGAAASPIVILAEQEHGAVFTGGTEAIHLINCSYVEIKGLVIIGQRGNGINVDDGGDYTTPSHNIIIRNCLFRDIDANGNNNFLKMSGVDNFLVENCTFSAGSPGGSGIDLVGCHWGVIQDCTFNDPGSKGIQNKGGTRHIRIQRNYFSDVSQRALNLGGNTGLQYFRPRLPDPIVDASEASDLEVFSNIFVRCWAPFAFVGCVRVKVYHNTIYHPRNWVIRILQETTTPGFLASGDNEFKNNLIYLANDLTEVNIGPNTAPETFEFSNNLWYNVSGSQAWSPNLPVPEENSIIEDPLFILHENNPFHVAPSSPAVGNGLELEEPVTDFRGRPFLNPPTIGAVEGIEVTSPASDVSHLPSVDISPNPVFDILHINGAGGVLQVSVLNSRGQMQRSFSGITLPVNLNISQLPAGVYFITLEDAASRQRSTKRIVKQ